MSNRSPKTILPALLVLVVLIVLLLARLVKDIPPTFLTPTPAHTTSTPASTRVPTAFNGTVGFIIPTTSTGTSLPPTSTPPTSTPQFEIAENSNQAAKFFGEAKVEYPLWLSPSSSDVVLFSISKPVQFAPIVRPPSFIERVSIPFDSPPILGQFSTYFATILITDTMRAELTSPTFEILPLAPSRQKVDVVNLDQPTTWAWAIEAPNIRGQHVLNVRAFLAQSTQPVWLRSFYVEVHEFTPTPLPNAAPVPTPTKTYGQRIIGSLADNPIPFLTLIVSLVFGVILIRLAASKQKQPLDNKTPAIRPVPSNKQPPVLNRVLLLQLMDDSFKLGDVKRLCFNLSIDFDNLSGLNKLDKLQDLIEHCEQTGRISDLLRHCQALRPNRKWYKAWSGN